MSETMVEPVDVLSVSSGNGELDRLMTAKVPSPDVIQGAVIGRLVGFANEGFTPLVTFDGQRGSAAALARATVDLRRSQIGSSVVLVFEHGDPLQPIVTGCLHDPHPTSLPESPGQVEVDADGQRLIVTAKQQLVLRCGKASITLTRAGKVLIHGTFVSNRSSGVLRLTGGSVQIN
jgi:hypothetical protein